MNDANDSNTVSAPERAREEAMLRCILFVPVLLLLGALAPTQAWAQTPEERIQEALSQVEEAELPASLLESKLAEGQAKGVPMERVADAMETRAEALAEARDAMAAGAPDDLDPTQIAMGADALGAGVSEEVLQEIAATTPGERRAVAVAALTHLVDQDVAPEHALEQVQSAMAREAPGLGHLPGVAGPPSLHPGAGTDGMPTGIPGLGDGGMPMGIPSPGQGGPPDDLPGGPPGDRGPPDG